MPNTNFPGNTIYADNYRLYTGVWEDLRFSAAGINPPGAASAPVRDTEDGCFLFSASATNIIALQVQMPHRWAEGTPIGLHLHWSPTNTNTGNVLWRAEYKMANAGSAFPASWTVLDMLDPGSGIAEDHLVDAWDYVLMTGMLISCMIKIKISRIGGDVTDTYNANARLLEFDIHYLSDSLGSVQEYVK